MKEFKDVLLLSREDIHYPVKIDYLLQQLYIVFEKVYISKV